jgi:DNA-binding CsgD family transcriptional regulator/tetratricopeptide (TPR) repeat protein
MPAGFSSARFVGRESAFVRLAPVLQAATDGSSSTVLLDGPGGIGASRLLTEASGRLTGLSRPFTVLRGRSRPAGTDSPYAPIKRALAPTLMGLSEKDLAALVGSGAEDLVRLLPELHARLAHAGALPSRPSVTSAERRQTRVLEGILGVLGRLGERQPVLLILEDLHHADAATRAFASFLARVQRPHRLCLLASYQPDDMTRSHPLAAGIAAMMGARRPPTRLSLEPLGRSELADLVEGIEGERPTGSALVLVAERSGGSPLVAEELLAARRELSGASLTGSLEDLVIARLGLRSPECRRVLRLLAPAGRPLTTAELADVAAAYELTAEGRRPPRSTSVPRRSEGVLDADLAAGLAEGVEHGMIELDGESVDFRHELIGRAVTADLLPRQHHRHNLALGAGLAGHPAAAARHWNMAHATIETHDSAMVAAGRAEAVYAPEDALRYLELALSSIDRQATSSAGGGSRARDGRANVTPLQIRAAEAAFAAGRPARAAAFVETVMRAFDERRDRVALGLLHERLGRYRRAAGDSAGAVAALERAVAFVPPGPSVERATVLAALAQVKMLEGTFSEAERLAREAIRIAEACAPDGRSQLAHATTTLGVSLGWGDDPEAAVALLGEARALAEAAGDQDELFRVYANLTTVLDLVGQRKAAVEVAYEGIEATRAAGLEAVYGNFLRGNAADSLFRLGRWAEARALSATALEWSPAGVAFLNSVDSLAILEIETRAGEYAGRLLGQLLIELETVNESQHAVPVYRAAASFALWRHDYLDALRAAQRGWELIVGSEDWVLMAKMAASLAEVDSTAAAADVRKRRDLAGLANARSRTKEVVAAAEAAVSASGVAPTIGSRREADAYLALAVAHRERLDGTDDPAVWAALAENWEKLAMPYEVARARWRQAEALLGSGEGRAVRPRAKAPLRAAAEIGLELSARPLLRELRELGQRAMIKLPAGVDLLLAEDGQAVPEKAAVLGQLAGVAADGSNGSSELIRGVVGATSVPRGDTFGLSKREHEVLALMSEGRTNREIGERLFISQKTVGVHVGNILAKLGVSGRVEAAAVAIRLGLAGDS